MAPRLRDAGPAVDDIPLTPAAIAAYKAMKALAKCCTCSGDYRQQRCPACTAQQDHEMVIHRELKCRPWEIPPFWPEPGDGNNKWARLAYARYLALERAIKATRRQPAPHDLLSRREGTR